MGADGGREEEEGIHKSEGVIEKEGLRFPQLGWGYRAGRAEDLKELA